MSRMSISAAFVAVAFLFVGQAAAQTSDSRQLFAQLDRAHRGYLGKSDVTSNQYLSRHFGECDSDGDGRLSSAEVDACMPHESPQAN